MEENMGINLKRYFGIYILSFIGFSIALALARIFLKISLTGLDLLVIMVSAQMCVGIFLKRERRLPYGLEYKKLVWGSFAITITLTLMQGSMILFMPELMEVLTDTDADARQFMITFSIIAAAIMLLVSFFMLRWIYGSYAKRQYKAMVKKGIITEMDVFD